MAQHLLPELEEYVNLDPLTDEQMRADEARRMFEVTFSDPQLAGIWMNDYFDLLAEGYRWRVAVYMIWASQPRDRRVPSTQHKLATEILGLTSDRQIREWKANDKSIETRLRTLQISAMAKARADVIDAWNRAASNPSPRASQDRKTWLEADGIYTPKKRLVTGPEGESDLDEMSDRDLAALEAGPSGE